MKAKIVVEPNIVKFGGQDYDIQLDFYSLKEIGKKYGNGIDEVLSRFEDLDVVFDVLSIMMNSNIVKRNYERGENTPLLNGDYVSAMIPFKEMPKYTEAIAKAFGLEIKKEDESDEMDKLLDEAGVENPKKTEAENSI